MVRKQFTFYESFASALFHIKKKSDRLAAMEAVIRYALYEEPIDPDSLPDGAAPVFLLIRPVLDAARRKAAAGQKGGEACADSAEANGKQTASKKEKETEKEYEYDKEKDIDIDRKNDRENECFPGLGRTGAYRPAAWGAL